MARDAMVVALCLAALAGAQTSDPAQRGYQALRERDYEAAILYLTNAIRAAPGRAILRNRRRQGPDCAPIQVDTGPSTRPPA